MFRMQIRMERTTSAAAIAQEMGEIGARISRGTRTLTATIIHRICGSVTWAAAIPIADPSKDG